MTDPELIALSWQDKLRAVAALSHTEQQALCERLHIQYPHPLGVVGIVAGLNALQDPQNAKNIRSWLR